MQSKLPSRKGGFLTGNNMSTESKNTAPVPNKTEEAKKKAAERRKKEAARRREAEKRRYFEYYDDIKHDRNKEW